MKDLVILAADKSIEQALKGLLERTAALGTRKVNSDIFIHPEHDPACARRGVEFLSAPGFVEQYRYCLLIFDYEGSGRENLSPRQLKHEINTEFAGTPWGERARAVLLVPELEAWVWCDSPHVDDVIGWKDRQPSLRQWLQEDGWLKEGGRKPDRPKEAFEEALWLSRKPRSSSLYLQIARRVSLAQCEDSAFREFNKVLRDWFPPSE